MDNNQPTYFNSLRTSTNCCSGTRGPSPSVYCDGNNRVTELYWTSLSLDGVINGTALPPNLSILKLYGNRIHGSIPALPTGLIDLGITNNFLTGDLPIFPSTLKILYLSFNGETNHFTGSLRMNQPTILCMSDNWITDVIIQDTSQLIQGSNCFGGTTNCDLSNNPLLGNSNILGLSMCLKNGLYSPSLLPKTLTSTKLSTTTTKATTTTTSKFTSKSTTTSTPAVETTWKTTTMVSTTTELPITSAATTTVKSPTTVPTSTTTAPTTSAFVLKTTGWTSPISSFSLSSTLTNIVSSSTSYDSNKSTQDNNAYSAIADLITSIPIQLTVSQPFQRSDDFNSLYSYASANTTIENPNVIATSSAAVIQDGKVNEFADVDFNLIYGLAGGLGGLCILVLVTSLVFKHPKMHSKYGRKNSFGTLNTVVTKETR